MSKRLLPVLKRSLGLRTLQHGFSTSLKAQQDPSKLVHNVTKEQMAENPVVADFMKSNFPESFSSGESEHSSISQRESENVEDLELSEEIVEANELNVRPITCYLRDADKEDGSRRSEELRQNGFIPGILYGSDPTQGIFSHQPESKTLVKTPWKFLQRELDRYHHSFESRVYDLTILESPDDDSGGLVHRVIPKNVQRHPVLSSIYCANFLRYHPGRPIKIPLVYANEDESSALKRGGFILPIQRYVECFVEEGAPFPDLLEIECTGLQFKEVIRVDRVLLPDNVRFSDRVAKQADSFILGVVHGKSRDKADEDGDADGTSSEE